MGVPACAVLSLTDWHPHPQNKNQKRKILTKITNPNKVHLHIMKTIIFRKQIELTVMIGQPPTGLVIPEPYLASCPIVTVTPSVF